MTRSRLSRLVLTAVGAGLAGAALAFSGAGGTEAFAQSADSVTFNRDVAPILYANCVSCHRPGEVGPMSLITFADVRPWARAIKQRVVSRALPPWGADRAHGKFANDPSMDEQKIRTIAAWVDGGAPEGTGALPPLPRFADGWQIGKPDHVFEMPADFEVPARGAVDYQYFEVPTNFTEDRWVQAMEIRPGARDAVHHVILYAREPDGSPARSGTLSQPPGQGLPTPKVLNALLNSLPDVYRTAEVVGKWVWVQFKEQPAAEIRQQLAQLGFHWNRDRQAWQHPCGKFSAGSQQDPHEKYSSYQPARVRRSTKAQTPEAVAA
jgi:hypothetical protein